MGDVVSNTALTAWRDARREVVKMGGGMTVWETLDTVLSRGGTLSPTADSSGSLSVLLPYISQNMEAWGATCGEACCAVSNCGREKCFHCSTILHRAGAATQPARYTCMDLHCPETTGVGLVCEACFASPSFMHEHEAFVRVDNSAHTIVRRTVGLADREPLREEDVLPLSCPVCLNTFSATVIPGALPGCPRQHTGVPGEGLVCVTCISDMVCSQGGLLRPRGGGNASVHCRECDRDAEAAAFGKEATVARNEAFAAFNSLQETEGPHAQWRSAVSAIKTVLSLSDADEDSFSTADGTVTAQWSDFVDACVKRTRALHPQKHIQAAVVAAFRGALD